MASANSTQKPLLKWPGGKYREYSKFQQYLPASFDRYVEPFAGGAGVFFAHAPQGRVLLNDLCTDLIEFYQAVKTGLYAQDFVRVAGMWTALTDYARDIHDLFGGFYRTDEAIPHQYFIPCPALAWEMELLPYVYATVSDKIRRIKKIEAEKGICFTSAELFDHTETAVRTAFYNYFRAIANGEQASEIPRTVAWVFVREFCYSSMFRTGPKGCNVPYGGISYNSKNIAEKIQQINSAHVADLFASAEFTNLDFERFFHTVDPGAGDFLFLDPPYDSPFSAYDDNAFNRADHTRLAALLATTPAKWMMVISWTEFIGGLYDEMLGVNAEFFDKKYSANMRNRGNQEAVHVIYRNYQN